MIKAFKVLLLLLALSNITNSMEEDNQKNQPKSLISISNNAIYNYLLDKKMIKLLNFKTLTDDGKYIVKKNIILNNIHTYGLYLQMISQKLLLKVITVK